MAQLKDTVISGSLRVTDTTYTTNAVITNTTTPTIETGDYLILADNNQGNKLLKGPSFTTTSTTKWLTQAGSWSTPAATDIGLGSTFFAPTTSGTVNHVLTSSGNNANPTWTEYLSVSQGGTGAKTLASGQALIGNDTGAIQTRGIIDKNAASHIGWQSGDSADAIANNTSLLDLNAVAYWNGAYNGNNKSNLTYCKNGEFGDSILGNARVFYGTCSSGGGDNPKVVVCSKYKQNTITTGDIFVVIFTAKNTVAVDSLTMKIQNKSNDPDYTSSNSPKIQCQVANSVGNLPGTDYIQANRPYMFVYDGTNWIMMNVNRDNNDNNIDRLQSASGTRQAETQALGGVGLHRYSLEMMTISGKWSSVASNHPTDATSNEDNKVATRSDCNFLINTPIHYHNNNTNAAPGGSVSDTGFSAIPINFRRAAASSTGWTNFTAQQPVYLIGQIQSDKKSFKLKSTTWWTQTLPSTNDGYIYIFMGMAGDSTSIYLAPAHPIYWHDGVQLKIYSGEVSYGTALPATGREGQVFFQVSEPWYEIPNGGTSGQALIKASNDSRDVTWGNVGGVMTPGNTKYYVSGSTTTTENTNPAVFNTNIFVENNVLMGAAWNDYAEYRQCDDKIEPGRCIVENGDGTLSLSIDRLQPGAEIVSDTFGFAIGKTTKSRTPVAISGRVLAYPYESLHKLKIGAPVCSGPNGTVSQMTDKEARKYPWLIIGTISAIPKEKEWGENKIKVNNRIWIRVR